MLEPPQTRASAEFSTPQQAWQRLNVGLTTAAAFASLAMLPYAADAAPFLSSTGVFPDPNNFHLYCSKVYC